MRAGTEYFWHARSLITDTDPDIWSDWSPPARFTTPEDVVTGGSVGQAAPFSQPGGRDPDRILGLGVVQDVAAEHETELRNSCQSHGGSWDFMELVVEALRATDGRWGFNCKRGNCDDVSHDVVAFYRGPGTTIDDAQRKTDVAIIDIILGHCGPNPQPTWIDQTQATEDAGAIGRWKYPR